MFRKLIGALVGLAMMGMAGTANATLVLDLTPPVISNFVVSPGTWNETEDIVGEISFDFNDGTDPFSYVFLFAFETAGPITIGSVVLTPIINGDNAGYFDAGAVAPFTYVAGSGFGIFELAVTVTDPSANQGFGVTLYTINSVPEPAAISLFAVGLAGLGFLMRRRKNRRRQA